MATLNYDSNLKLASNALFRSIVNISTGSHRFAGFFVTHDTILTSSHLLKKNDKSQIKIFQGEREYKISGDIKLDASVNVAAIQVKVGDDWETCCVEIDFRDRSNGEFFIPNGSTEENSILVDVQQRRGSGQEESISFVGKDLGAELNGLPLVNAKTGKVCGIVHFQSPRASIESTDGNRLNRGYAVPLAAIDRAFPSLNLSELNSSFHHFRAAYHLPPRGYQRFVGREAEVEKLLSYISFNRRQHIVVVGGIGGIGKTALVLKAMYQCLRARQTRENTEKIPSFDVVIFVSLQNNEKFAKKKIFTDNNLPDVGLLMVTRTISDALNISPNSYSYSDENHDVLYTHLSKQNTLLVIDGMNETASDESMKIIEFLNNLPVSSKAIITTRQQSILNSNISLFPLSSPESTALIQARAKAKGVVLTAEEVVSLGQALAGSPIAIEYAIGQCAVGYTTVQELASIAAFGSTSPSKRCFDHMIKSIKLKDPIAYSLLMALSFFCPNATTKALAQVIEDVSAPLLQDALSKLRDLALINTEWTDGEYRHSILRITRGYVLDELENSLERDNTFDQKAARKRWVDYHQDFVDKYSWEGSVDEDQQVSSELENIGSELENIGEVLFWCADNGRYGTVNIIWNRIDPYIKRKQYWMIRFYWWSYLQKESQKRSEIPTYVKALSEKAMTWVQLGREHCKEAQECLLEASRLGKYADKTVQSNLEDYLSKIDKVCGEIGISYQPLSLK